MGLLTNFSVYGLMIVPVVMMARGHSVRFHKAVLLIVIMTLLQCAESIIATSVPAQVDPVVYMSVIPTIEGLFFHFMLNDSAAARTFRLAEVGDGDVPATVATLWHTCYTIVFRWFSWYHGMSALGWEADQLLCAAAAFLQLVGTLVICRQLQGQKSVVKGGAVVLLVHAVGYGLATTVSHGTRRFPLV